MPTFSGLLGKVYCKDVDELPGAMDEARVGLQKLEEALEKSQVDGAPYFSGVSCVSWTPLMHRSFNAFRWLKTNLRKRTHEQLSTRKSWARPSPTPPQSTVQWLIRLTTNTS